MLAYFTPSVNCDVTPASGGNQHFARLFRFHLPYAACSYYLNRKITLCRYYYHHQLFGIDFYQGGSLDELLLTCRFNHSYPVLLMALTGSLYLTDRNKKVLAELQQGECLLTCWPAGEYRVFARKTKNKLLLLSLKATWFKQVFKAYPILAYPFKLSLSRPISMPVCAMKFPQWRLVLQLLQPQQQAGTAIQRYLKDIIVRIVLQYEQGLRERQMPMQQRIDKITAYILLSIHQYQRIPEVSQVAAKFGFTRRGLEKTCREVTGLAPIQFINNLRLAEGRQLLAETDKTVKEIADLLLYNSHSHFTSAFHHQFGLKPSAFRELQKNGLSNLVTQKHLKNRAKI